MRAQGAAGNWRHEVPVEMRFVDLFMAAFGALMFMIMVLVAIVARMPSEAPQLTRPSASPLERKLDLLTRDLPAAEAGQRYDQPLAVRGGEGPLTWQVLAGSLPDGISFDLRDGVFKGLPTVAASTQLIVRVRDVRHGSAERAYTLSVLPPVSRSRVSTWFPYIFAAFLALVALALFGGAANVSHEIGLLDQAAEAGQSEVTFIAGRGVKHIVDVSSGGRETKLVERRGMQFAGAVFVMLALLVVAYIVVTRFWH
jgi:hypothetical protein